MTTLEPAGAQSTDGRSRSDEEARVLLGGDQVGRLSAGLEDAFTLDQLMGLEGNLSLTLDAVVPVAGRNLHDIFHDLVLWSLRDRGIAAVVEEQKPVHMSWWLKSEERSIV